MRGRFLWGSGGFRICRFPVAAIRTGSHPGTPAVPNAVSTNAEPMGRTAIEYRG